MQISQAAEKAAAQSDREINGYRIESISITHDRQEHYQRQSIMTSQVRPHARSLWVGEMKHARPFFRGFASLSQPRGHMRGVWGFPGWEAWLDLVAGASQSIMRSQERMCARF